MTTASANAPGPAADAQSGRARERRIRRLEDPALLRGRGHFTDDIHLPGMLHARTVRSPAAHGILRSIDSAPALARSGVVGVFTASDFDRLGVGELAVLSRAPGQRNFSNPALARDRVRYVGQPVAVVVTEDPYAAEDAAAAVGLEIEERPAVTGAPASVAADAELLYPDWGTNIAAERRVGTGCDDEIFERAALVIAERFTIQRQTGLPLEPRAIVASHDAASGETTAWVSTQSPHHVRGAIAEICGWREHTLRVISPDVGGAFGTKEYPLAEELLACVLTRQLGRPVKWLIDMREHLLSTPHAREQVWDLELAADGGGRILGVRGRLLYDVGAHLASTGLGAGLQAATLFPGPYDFPALDLQVQAVVTNKVPAGAYRGFGAPQAAFVMERLIDELARRLGADRAEIRRRNLIAPGSQPYANPAGRRYDGGDYALPLERALGAIGYDRFEDERRAAAARGRRLGLGIGSFVLAGGLAPSRLLGAAGSEFGAHSSSTVRMDADGRATVLSGVCAQGQGTKTAFAQLCAEQLGLDPRHDVTVVLGDTALTPFDSAGSISSRVTSVAGASVSHAAGILRDKLVELAAHRLEAHADDVELGDGAAFVKGSPAQRIPIGELARAAYLGHDLPAEMEPGLEAHATVDPPETTYPFSTHAAVVEVDPETFALRVLRYVVAHDSGVVVNPMLLEGQIVGGVAQGLAGAIFEHLVYDLGGQPLATSLLDYLVPSAADLPAIEMILLETPAHPALGGVKGGAEAGAVGPAAVVAGAVADALGDGHPTVARLPLDPQTVFELARGNPHAAAASAR